MDPQLQLRTAMDTLTGARTTLATLAQSVQDAMAAVSKDIRDAQQRLDMALAMADGAGEVDHPIPAATVELASRVQMHGVAATKSLDEVAAVIAVADDTGASINAVANHVGLSHFLVRNIIRTANKYRAQDAEASPADAELRRAMAGVIVAAGHSPLSINETAAALAESDRRRAAGQHPIPYTSEYGLRSILADIIAAADSLRRAVPEPVKKPRSRTNPQRRQTALAKVG
ncbi:hypothetical protein [Nocardia altamirensis]|uniref:hypothetical protein n=1 Tax=Nocardia altamirensis TaxID=472158 RepID=UPI0008402DB5|nr:hypothetical protein [Nocardia altamirensis]